MKLRWISEAGKKGKWMAAVDYKCNNACGFSHKIFIKILLTLRKGLFFFILKYSISIQCKYGLTGKPPLFDVSLITENYKPKNNLKIIPLKNNHINIYLQHKCTSTYNHQEKKLYWNGPIILWFAMARLTLGQSSKKQNMKGQIKPHQEFFYMQG